MTIVGTRPIATLVETALRWLELTHNATSCAEMGLSIKAMDIH